MQTKKIKSKTSFSLEHYNNCQNQQHYLLELLEKVLKKNKIEIDRLTLSISQLESLMNEICIPMKNKQLHELYIYASCEDGENPLKNQAEKLQSVINNEKSRINLQFVVKWLQSAIQKKTIKFSNTSIPFLGPRAERGLFSSKKQENPRPRAMTSVHSSLPRSYLPRIENSSSSDTKLTHELKYLIEIFEEMESERQNSGLFPISFDNDENSQLPPHIPYSEELSHLNKSLSKLKLKAEDRLTRIIELARSEPKIREKIEEAIAKFQRLRIESNEKIGRIGAMKAQKRVIYHRKKEENKYKKLRLGEEEDLLRAAKIYSLLAIPEIKNNRLIF